MSQNVRISVITNQRLIEIKAKRVRGENLSFSKQDIVSDAIKSLHKKEMKK